MTPTRDVLVRGGSVFDSESRMFQPGVDILCRAGRIVQVGRDLAAGEAAEIDAGGMFVLPGLIDWHVHLTSEGGATELNDSRFDSSATRAWKAARAAKATLEAGFTTVRDLGAAEAMNVDLARAIEAGLVAGPRVLASGLGVTMTGGHGHGFIAREADGPDEVRKAVREQLRAGATTIKLFASGGAMTAGVDPMSPSFTEAEMAAGVEEAHKAFRVIAAHAQATEGIKNAVRAGVDSIEHGVWLDAEGIELVLERGTYLVPTLTAPYHIAKGGLEAGIPPYMVEKANLVLEDHIRSFQAALKAGVRVAMGTDEGTPLNRPGENAQETLRMAQHGLSPGAAILAATAWAADLLHVQAGRLGAGLFADILCLRRDPLEDLGALADASCIATIIKEGTIVKAAEPKAPGGLTA